MSSKVMAMEAHIQVIIQQLLQLLTRYGLAAIGACIILILGRFAAKILSSAVRTTLLRMRLDATFVVFAGNVVYWAVITFAVISALSDFGVQTASFVAVIGAISFAAGLALQGSLSNFTSGVMILLFRPFRLGDNIETVGTRGEVVEIEIFSTILRTAENVKVIIPNARVYGDVIKNYSAFQGEPQMAGPKAP